jgi:hypothetical protein
MSLITEPLKYTRLAFDLRDFLRKKITLEDSIEVIANRLRNRSNNFLNIVQKGIFENPKSPYLKLLNLAGCEYGDIESMVSRDGIEGTLQRLYSEGVYISWEEFKAKKDVVRSGRSFKFREADFDNPFLASYYHARSSGSRSAGTRTIFDLRHRLDISYYFPPTLAVAEAMDAPMGAWVPSFPSIAGISAVLHHWNIGKPVMRWFSPANEGEMRASLRDKMALRYIVYGGRLWGARLSMPEYVSSLEAVKIAQWMADIKRDYGACSLTTFIGLMVRVCNAAMEYGLDISNTRFLGGGEPLTEAKRRQIEAAGAKVYPKYWITEIGLVGCGCSEATAPDDIHLFSDSAAVIQRRRRVEQTDIDVNAFLFTGLLPSSPKIMLNMETDDFGEIETRKCGCLFDQLGFNNHIYNIRSYAKLTGSSMSIIGSDFIRILEEVLPDKYGGAPTDYQLLEEEDAEGITHLSLVISPSVGEIDENGVIVTVLEELRNSAHGGNLAAALWSQVNALGVKRMNPISKSGKVMTLHLVKNGQQRKD